MQGWVKLHRQITHNHFWLSEPFTRGQAWVDLLMLANHREGIVRKQGVRIDLNRGDVGWSEVELGRRWRWSRGKVRRFLDELEMEQMVDRKRYSGQDKRKFIITISNYEKYQGEVFLGDTSDDTGDGHETVQATDKRRYKNNNEKNAKNKKNTYTQDFEAFWAAYPSRQGKKVGKAEAFKEWKKAVKEVEGEFLISKITELAPQYGDYPKDACRWLKNKQWEDEMSGYVPASEYPDQFAGVI